MSLGQWSRRSGFTEVRRPLPVLDLWHVFKVLTDVVVMFIELPAEHLDCIRSLHAKAGDVFQCVQRKMKAAHFVEHDHVKRCGGRTLVIITMNMEAAFIGGTMNKEA